MEPRPARIEDHSGRRDAKVRWAAGF
jgi:hypothetical protein